MIFEDEIKSVADHWGDKMPMMAMEECAEVIQAISKVERNTDIFRKCLESDPEVADAAQYQWSGSKDKLTDEIRDVYISMRALIYYYNLDEVKILEKVKTKLNKKYD